MLSHTLISCRIRRRWVARRLSVAAFAGAIGAIAGCRDAATDITAPMQPQPNVSSNGIWMVNSLEDPGDGVCLNNQCTLREAIASAQNGERITFKGNLSGTIALTAGELLIDESITVESPGPDKLTVSGQGLSRVLHIGSVNPAVSVVISGLTITGGYVEPGKGGGVFVREGSRLTLIGSLVTGNSATEGAGIYSDGTLAVVGSTIAANSASFGGGGITSDGELTVSRSTVSGNTAAISSAGGILVLCNNSCGAGAALRSSTITNNDAVSGGGGVYILGPTVLSNTIIAGNRSAGDPDASEADCGDVGYLLSLGHNLSTLNTGCHLDNATDVDLGLSSQVFTFVLVPVLANNGSPRMTHALVERGLAVDAGYCPGEGGDQRGFPRPYDDLRMPNALDGCDIGAFEWNPADTKTKGPKP